jgi:hypothetical protein
MATQKNASVHHVHIDRASLRILCRYDILADLQSIKCSILI